jgi:hypothetical protein
VVFPPGILVRQTVELLPVSTTSAEGVPPTAGPAPYGAGLTGAAGASSATADQAEPRRGRLRLLASLTAGLGVAMVALGAIGTVLAYREARDYNQNCNVHLPLPAGCDAIEAAFGRYRAMEIAGFVVAGPLAAMSVVTYILSRRSSHPHSQVPARRRWADWRLQAGPGQLGMALWTRW